MSTPSSPFLSRSPSTTVVDSHSTQASTNDTVMSNDEEDAMSESSSLDIETPPLPLDDMEFHLNNQPSSPSSWTELVTPRSHLTQWCHLSFTPAMSKSTRINDSDSLYSNVNKIKWSDADDTYHDRIGHHLHSLQNQVIGVQLRIVSNHSFLLTTSTTNWFLSQGHTSRARIEVDTTCLPSSIQVVVLTIGYVQDELNQERMETLHLQTVVSSLERMHALYLRIHIGCNIKPGLYDIPIHLYTQHAGFTDEYLSWSTTLHLHIINLTLPSPSFHMNLWQHPTAIARAHTVPLWSERHYQLLDRYYHSLSQLGQKSVTMIATEMPWSGQYCHQQVEYPSALYEHAILHCFQSSKDQPLDIDFQSFDRVLGIAESYDMAHEIEIFGLLSIWKDPLNGFDTPVNKGLDAWRIQCYNKTTHCRRYLRTMNEIERFLQVFYNYCLSRNLIDRIRICADEPSDLCVFQTQLKFLQRIGPRFCIKVAVNHSEIMMTLASQGIQVVPLLSLVNGDSQIRSQWKTIHSHPCYSWYVCCQPSFPNQFVSSPLIEGELIGLISFWLGLNGFLRWNFCLWPSTPWKNLKWKWPVGDMYFVLPGVDGSPIETLRYEALRYGVQTYELLCLTQSILSCVEWNKLEMELSSLIWKTPEKAAFQTHVKMGKKAEDLYALDPIIYEQVRIRMIEALAIAIAIE